MIWSEGVKILCIAFADDASIKLEDIALILECKSNFISLRQLQDSKIIYRNKSTHMLQMQNDLLIA